MSIECSQVNCKHIRSITCDSYVAEKREKKTPRCKNILQKLCQKCNLNKVPTKCSQSTVNCNEKSTVVLKCGHEATWLCGSDDDPRDYPLLCQFCIFPKWKELIENEPSPDIELQLRKKLMNQIDTLLKDVEITEQEIFEPRDLEIHTESRKNIINQFMESTDSKLGIPMTESLADTSFYELVFTQVKGKQCFYYLTSLFIIFKN